MRARELRDLLNKKTDEELEAILVVRADRTECVDGWPGSIEFVEATNFMCKVEELPERIVQCRHDLGKREINVRGNVKVIRL